MICSIFQNNNNAQNTIRIKCNNNNNYYHHHHHHHNKSIYNAYINNVKFLIANSSSTLIFLLSSSVWPSCRPHPIQLHAMFAGIFFDFVYCKWITKIKLSSCICVSSYLLIRFGGIICLIYTTDNNKMICEFLDSFE